MNSRRQSGQKVSRPPRRLERVQETSAGGFVLAADGSIRVALIGRQNRSGRIDWCVPKGHPEGSESLQEAAIREVAEETGLEVEIIEPLGQISYEFTGSGKLISKTVHHFLMRQVGGDLTVENDPNHEAIDVQWFELDTINEVLSHENERRLARGVIEWVQRNGGTSAG
jgi:ADP-ribose pyrophosphatase YjhB (NUDIX family)